MQKIIKEVDQKRGILQITVADERWYLKQSRDPETDLPIYKGVPSVTWIAGYYPKGIGFYKWLAEMGWDEAQAAKQAAGDKGSKVHLAIEMILNGEEFRVDTKVLNKSTGQMEELTFEELLCVKSFCDWRAEAKPEIISTERVVFSDIHGYAGRVDLICRIDGVPYVIDFKTSKQIWREHEMQVSAYRVALENGENPIHERNANGTEGKLIDPSGLKTAILQVGYERNKAGWKFTEIEDNFPLFLVAKQIWQREAGDQDIKVRDFPIVLSPAAKKEEPAEAIAEAEPMGAAEALPLEESSAGGVEPPRPKKRAKVTVE